MRYVSNKTLFLSSILTLFFVVTFAIGTLRTAQAADEAPASGERLIVIHDASNNRGFLTKATTVRDALKEAAVPFDQNDLVEPGLDESLVASSYDINIYRARPVTIVDGAVRKKIMSAYRTPAQIVTHAGIELRDEDTTNMSLSNDSMRNGAAIQLTITRATPFTLVLYGKKTTAYTQAATVSEMLEDKQIVIGPDDKLSVSPGTALIAGMTVELWRDGTQTITEEANVQFETERIQDVDREVGYKEIRTPGVAGKRTVTYEIEMKNGQEVSRKEIQSVTTKEPTTQVEIIGAKMTNTFSGDFAQALARLRACESGGNYANKRNPKYRGAYQYDYSTWANYQGIYDPADAPPAVQDQKAWETYSRRGWQPWPSCSRSQGLQDIYR